MSACCLRLNISEDNIPFMPILVAVRSNASVRGRMIADISGSNTPENICVHSLSFLSFV
jgi:hypothetical protein